MVRDRQEHERTPPARVGRFPGVCHLLIDLRGRVGIAGRKPKAAEVNTPEVNEPEAGR